MARVDIVMALYNKSKTVLRSIESIRRQTFTDWRLIVVDDGSMDDGPSKVRGLNDTRIELIHQENRGPGAARNTGLFRANAPFVAFLDSDDEWLPGHLADSIAAFESNPDVGIVASMYYEWPHRMDMTGHWVRRGVHPGTKYRLTGNEDPIQADWILSFLHTDTTMIRTERAQRVGGFYAEDRCLLGEDTIFFMRIGIRETILPISPASVIHHREESDLSHYAERPLAPFLYDPKILLNECPDTHRFLMEQVIDHFALRVAHDKARHGLKSQAQDMVQRFPGISRFTDEYSRCQTAITYSRWLVVWVQFKSYFGPRIRSYWGRFSGR
ncbi:MAG: glycosyltransferase [Phycisphaerae bacterium]|nr:glycosyltransferase [Phycisphaerae bacterium]